ncbi:PaaI family thioesterase [Nocardia sp. CA-119907]|uniref:PaaI family thioesterase n=1 Tax=Nocardia sp. CA-119907 TaxID=3239973 RepID=UPI003D97E1ED
MTCLPGDPATSEADSTPLAPERVRTYAWTDPERVSEQAALLSGIEFLRATQELGIAAPMNNTAGIDLVVIEDGAVVLEFVPREWQYNLNGNVHGGMICTIADSAMAMSALSTLPAGLMPTTTDLQIRFFRPVTTDLGVVRCTGTVVHRGRRTCVARADLRDARGRMLAQATTTCLIIPRPAGDDRRIALGG